MNSRFFVIFIGFYFLVTASSRLVAQNTTSTTPKSISSKAKDSKVIKTPTKKAFSENEVDNYSSAVCYGLSTNTNSGLLGGVAFKTVKRLDNEFFDHPQFRYLSFELVNVKHPKEAPYTNLSNARFVYGKTNYLLSLRSQYGREIVLSSRNADEGISINVILAAGPTLGIVKPYVIQYETKPGTFRQEPYNPLIHTNPALIVGTGGFLQDFEKSNIALGINGKLAFNFELSALKNTTTGIEIGFLVEAFTKKIPILAVPSGVANPNKSTFSSAYLTLFFGNRK